VDDRKPWERQPGEPALWFSRFDRYFRPLGEERTIEEAWRRWKHDNARHSKTARPHKSWYRIAREWHWWERAEAWDDEQRRLRWAAEERERQEMLRRHIQMAQSMQSIGLLRLRELQQDPSDMTPTEAMRYITSGVKLEREARGLPSDLIAIMTMSDAELLARYRRLLEAISGHRGGDEAEGDTTASDLAEDNEPFDETGA